MSNFLISNLVSATLGSIRLTISAGESLAKSLDVPIVLRLYGLTACLYHLLEPCVGLFHLLLFPVFTPVPVQGRGAAESRDYTSDERDDFDA